LIKLDYGQIEYEQQVDHSISAPTIG